MRNWVTIGFAVLGLLSASAAAGGGQTGQQNPTSPLEQYQDHLRRIPPNLPPDQKVILEQKLKHHLSDKLLRQKAAIRRATSPPAGTPTKP